MKNKTLIKNPHESPFLGLFEGRRKRAKAEAEALRIEAAQKAAQALEEEKRRTFLLQLEAAKQGYEPEKAAAQQAIKLEETKQGSEKTLYVIVGFVVVAVMAAIYFIKKR